MIIYNKIKSNNLKVEQNNEHFKIIVIDMLLKN